MQLKIVKMAKFMFNVFYHTHTHTNFCLPGFFNDGVSILQVISFLLINLEGWHSHGKVSQPLKYGSMILLHLGTAM